MKRRSFIKSALILTTSLFVPSQVFAKSKIKVTGTSILNNGERVTSTEFVELLDKRLAVYNRQKLASIPIFRGSRGEIEDYLT